MRKKYYWRKLFLFLLLGGLLVAASVIMGLRMFSNPSAEREKAVHLGQLITLPLVQHKPEAEPEVPEQPPTAAQETVVKKTVQKAKADAVKAKAKGKSLPIKPKIGIMIAGLGLDKENTDIAMQLPAEVSMGFSPYGGFTTEYSALAADKGHDVFMHVPLELASNARNDSGPFALMTTLSPEENKKRLSFMLTKASSLNGVYITGNEIFSSTIEQSQAILEYLKTHKLTLVIGDIASADFASLARTMNLPNEVSQFWIDDELSEEAIQAKLDSLVDMAIKRRGVIVMGRPYPITINQLQIWLEKIADSQDVSIAPVSLVAKQRGEGLLKLTLPNPKKE